MVTSARRILIGVLLLSLLAALAWVRQRPEAGEMLSRQQLVMGTVVEITAYGDDRPRLEAGIAEAMAEMVRLEALLGPGAGSDLERLRHSTEPFEVAAETAEVITLALQVQELSGGAFDPGLGRLKTLWGVDGGEPHLPTPAQLGEALAGSGPGSLRLEGGRVYKTDPRLAVDLGGIAKGYAVDRAVEILRRAGAGGASVNAGGDIRLLGDRRGAPWRIGIQHPRLPQRVLGVLSLADTAVVTSGDYERFFERDGIRYHHLFDPRSGEPARLAQSVTVVAASAALADALATAAFVLGPAAGIELLEGLPGIEGMVVDATGRPHLTSGLRGEIQWP